MNAGEIALAVVFLAIATGIITGFSSPWLGKAESKPRRRPRAAKADPLARDPVGYVRDHGTPADGQRLDEHGLDLAGLGYRPPGE